MLLSPVYLINNYPFQQCFDGFLHVQKTQIKWKMAGVIRFILHIILSERDLVCMN